MNIILGAEGLYGHRTGVGRSTLELARQLHVHPAIAELRLLSGGHVHPYAWLQPLLSGAAPAQPTETTYVVSKARELAGRIPALRAVRNLALRVSLNAQATNVGAGDVLYHEPNLIAKPYDGPVVVTVNDLLWRHSPDLLPAERLRWIERNLPRVLSVARRLVCISEFTAQEAVRHLGISPDRLSVVPIAAATCFRPMAEVECAPILRQYGLIDHQYVLTVATLEPRKNLDRLLEAYLRLPAAVRERVPLVVAGPPGWGQVLRKTEHLRSAGQLILLGYLPDTDLAALTARCAAFAFVSLYEGFGLPVVEAMACGAPVLASRTTATGETAGSGALLCDPQDVASISEGLHQLLDDPAGCSTYREAGLRRAKEFSWRATADGFVRVWHDVLSNR